MEKLLNEFTVNRPIDAAWAVLTDVERIAPCLPGAELQEVEGATYRGVVKVKLGPVSASFKGQAQFVERDDTARRAVLKGEGRDTSGKGNASALVTAELQPVSAEVTLCKVSTDLQVTGKVAQFGRGIMGDVSEKLMHQFSKNLNAMLAAEPVAAAADTAAAGADATQPATSEAAPRVRAVQGPAAEPIELSDLAGSALLKRLVPLFGGLVILLFLLRRLRK
jgi:carbon monoxide dehydrogenase subunit G